jgi:hypothetical protein
MGTEIKANLTPAYLAKRRAVRYKLDVPLRVVFRKEEAVLIRDGRGTELSELGMCVWAPVELKIEDELQIEFTIPFSGEPIRVSGIVRNRKAYRYGCEFTPDNEGERADVARLLKVLQTYAEEPAPGCAPANNDKNLEHQEGHQQPPDFFQFAS